MGGRPAIRAYPAPLGPALCARHVVAATCPEGRCAAARAGFGTSPSNVGVAFYRLVPAVLKARLAGVVRVSAHPRLRAKQAGVHPTLWATDKTGILPILGDWRVQAESPRDRPRPEIPAALGLTVALPLSKLLGQHPHMATVRGGAMDDILRTCSAR
eukprot:CAMPEP_0117560752 /NCGR_PEP_ID=MMETSP0784-20121206/54039_1 /TAXON_ID=39447 /ORGANISM="" /LENGTH=156 /DNA_ID=CAMNT_0005358173 /DNA_START=29 /DNA_END=496 /DNA_ORIENTATION=-